MLGFKDTVRVARPLLWLNTAVLWVLALLVLEQPPTGADLLLIAYFTLPFNLWLHGINDIYDHESDLRNERKGSDEGARLPRAQHAPLRRAILAWNLPFWLLALWQGTPLAVVLLALFLFLGWAYSAPPVRGKGRPGLDSLINCAYFLPYAIALAWHRAPGLVWVASLPALLAFAAWAIASHAFTSIQDIEADRHAGIATIATALGAQRTAWLALAMYLLAAGTATRYGWGWGLGVALYPLLAAWYLRAPSRARANRLYRIFILLNSILGFVVTVTLALASPPNTLWAALVVLSLVALVAASRAWSNQ